MCEPTTIAALTAASAAVGAAGAYQQSRNTKKVAEYNAGVAELEAQDARRRGDQKADAVRRAAGQQTGAARAALSAKGLDISEGSAADMIDQIDFFGQVDAVTAKQNAAKEAWNLRARKAGYQFEADAQRPGLMAATSLLGSAGTVSDRWRTAYPKG